MTDKPNFSLKKVNKPNCSSGWNELHFAVGWNPNSIWEPNVMVFDNDELEELRRVLDIGMGDCDHCPAWEPYIRDCVLGKKVISHDMTRLNKHDLWLKGHKEMIDAHGKRLDGYDRHFVEHGEILLRLSNRLDKVAQRFEGGTRLEAVESESSNALAGFHTLAKLIDDLKVDLERVKTDMAVVKFALTTHMGMSHEQNK